MQNENKQIKMLHQYGLTYQLIAESYKDISFTIKVYKRYLGNSID